MITRGRVVILAGAMMLSGCTWLGIGSDMKLQEEPASQSLIAALGSERSTEPYFSRACFKPPKNRLGAGPAATYCVNTGAGFVCKPGCPR